MDPGSAHLGYLRSKCDLPCVGNRLPRPDFLKSMGTNRVQIGLASCGDEDMLHIGMIWPNNVL